MTSSTCDVVGQRLAALRVLLDERQHGGGEFLAVAETAGTAGSILGK